MYMAYQTHTGKNKNSKFTIQIYTLLFAYIQMQEDVVQASEALLPVVRSVVSIKF